MPGLKVSHGGKVPRTLVGVGGVLLLVLGSAITSPKPAHASSSVRFVVFDELGPSQIEQGQSEKVVVKIDGKHRGTLAVNKRKPKAHLDISVQEQGQHNYDIEAWVSVLVEKRLTRVKCSGTGVIDVAAGSRFVYSALFDPETRSCQAWLEKR